LAEAITELIRRDFKREERGSHGGGSGALEVVRIGPYA